MGEEKGLDDTVCPPGCDPAHFSLACELRESRLDVEETLGEEKRSMEQCRKELEAARKKLKTVDSHVKTSQTELEVHVTVYMYVCTYMYMCTEQQSDTRKKR